MAKTQKVLECGVALEKHHRLKTKFKKAVKFAWIFY